VPKEILGDELVRGDKGKKERNPVGMRKINGSSWCDIALNIFFSRLFYM
jgi:hypothetical protein